jgi:subtilisin
VNFRFPNLSYALAPWVVLWPFLLLSCGPKLDSSDLSQAAQGRRQIVIFKEKPSLTPGSVHASIENLGISPLKMTLFEHVFTGFAAALSNDEVSRLKGHPTVAAVLEDTVVQKPELLSNQKDEPLPLGEEVVPRGVARIKSPILPNLGIEIDATVAVIDSGVEANHPDLNVVHSVSFGDTPSGEDFCGHGTHVAGIIGAKSNNIGVVGVAPGVRIWSLNVTNASDCSGTLSASIKALDYVYEHRFEIDAVNMSVGSDAYPMDGCDPVKDPYRYAICRIRSAGIPVVVAAGNKGDDVTVRRTAPAMFPETIAVSAIQDFDGKPGALVGGFDDTLAPYSNYGSRITIAAPGSNILSTFKGSALTMKSGTSMAAPHVTGAVALIVANNRHLKESFKDNPALFADFILNTLVSMSAKAGSGDYFSGDKDASAEPMLQLADQLLSRPDEKKGAPPRIKSTTPPSGAKVDVTSFPGMVLVFAKPVQPGKDFNGVAFIHTRGVALRSSTLISVDGKTVVLRPQGTLSPGTHYRITLPRGFLIDAASLRQSQRTTLRFSTVPGA